VFYGLVFLDVVFEALLFSSDGEADVLKFVLLLTLSFHCLKVAECFPCSLYGHKPVDSRPRRFRRSLTYVSLCLR
jgi:hypothetical protein